MKKSYIFTISKYYNENEIAKVTPIIENFVALFADDDGVAALKLKDDVSIVVKRDEGLVLHMVLDNADHFTALPKTLTRAKDFLNKFVVAMAEAVDAEAQRAGIAIAKAKVESDAEDTLLDYIGAAPKKECNCDHCDCGAKTTVKVNGQEVTDPDEKKKVEEEIDAKVKEIREKVGKMFSDTFTDIFKGLVKDNDWLKDYLGD